MKVLDVVRLTKRGYERWQCFFYRDNEELLNLFLDTIGLEELYRITDDSFMPL